MEATKKKTLFDIGEDLEALEALINEVEGDISDPAVEAAITKWFAEIEGDMGKKVDGYVNLMRKWDAEAAAAQAEAELYQKRARVRTNRYDTLKARLKLFMEFAKKQKIETPTGRTVAIQNNGGKTPIFIDPNVVPLKLPERFQRKTIELDTDAVRAALEAGETLPFARLTPKGTHLRIR